MVQKKGLLERLRDGVVIGDGGFTFALEKRGYVMAGPWTPEATCEHPEAVRQLHREFLRAGSDVMQAFSFYASDDKLKHGGNEAGVRFTCEQINRAACGLAKEVAAEGDALVLGGITQTPSYRSGDGKEAVQELLRRQIKVFLEEEVDFLMCEYFDHVEELEWAIEVCKETNLPVAATMCIGKWGDLHHNTPGECAVRMAKAGADVLGVNCHYDPFVSLETMKMMKESLEDANLHPYLMMQPIGFFSPDAGQLGYLDLPEFPFAVEPRVCTRWDFHRFARAAYNLGIRYIGGCCGVEPHHIRAVAEELAPERGCLPEGSQKHDPWGEGMRMSTKESVRAKASKDYWLQLTPATGRPNSKALSTPFEDGIIKNLKKTSIEELKMVTIKNESQAGERAA